MEKDGVGGGLQGIVDGGKEGGEITKTARAGGRVQLSGKKNLSSLYRLIKPLPEDIFTLKYVLKLVFMWSTCSIVWNAPSESASVLNDIEVKAAANKADLEESRCHDFD